jgi:hypothetical protein
VSVASIFKDHVAHALLTRGKSRSQLRTHTLSTTKRSQLFGQVAQRGFSLGHVIIKIAYDVTMIIRIKDARCDADKECSGDIEQIWDEQKSSFISELSQDKYGSSRPQWR